MIIENKYVEDEVVTVVEGNITSGAARTADLTFPADLATILSTHRMMLHIRTRIIQPQLNEPGTSNEIDTEQVIDTSRNNDFPVHIKLSR